MPGRADPGGAMVKVSAAPVRNAIFMALFLVVVVSAIFQASGSGELAARTANDPLSATLFDAGPSSTTPVKSLSEAPAIYRWWLMHSGASDELAACHIFGPGEQDRSLATAFQDYARNGPRYDLQLHWNFCVRLWDKLPMAAASELYRRDLQFLITTGLAVVLVLTLLSTGIGKQAEPGKRKVLIKMVLVWPIALGYFLALASARQKDIPSLELPKAILTTQVCMQIWDVGCLALLAAAVCGAVALFRAHRDRGRRKTRAQRRARSPCRLESLSPVLPVAEAGSKSDSAPSRSGDNLEIGARVRFLPQKRAAHAHSRLPPNIAFLMGCPSRSGSCAELGLNSTLAQPHCVH
jgi:hypothetical protein